MKKFTLASLMVVVSSFSVQAADVDHFKGAASPDLQSALCNLQKFDKKMAKLVGKKKMEMEDLAEIHELTYTLEVAVQRVQSEMNVVAEELEKAHKGSEVLAEAKVKKAAKEYLDRTKLLTSKLACK